MAKQEKKQRKEAKKSQKEINRDNLREGMALIMRHPLFGYCFGCYRRIADKNLLGAKTMCIVKSTGEIISNEDITLNPKQWAYVIAHNMLHLAFGHFDAAKMPGYLTTDEDGVSVRKVSCDPLLWNMACDIYVDKFLADIKFGQSIHSDPTVICNGNCDDEQKIYDMLLHSGVKAETNQFGTSAVGTFDMSGLEHPLTYREEAGECNRFTAEFTRALARSVTKTVTEAGGHEYSDDNYRSICQQAAKWFIDHYPLLGGLAAHFQIVEDYVSCGKNDIRIAAIDVINGKLYLNPAAGLSFEEWKFVLAHEYLHAGLMHHARCNGRDRYLWNVACDYVINGWLHELQIGAMPRGGLLYDPDLKGLSAETIYDMILGDMKKYAKLNTFRGNHKGDILGDAVSKSTDGVSLDDFCRNAMQQGLEYHIGVGRGLIPAGMIEEIRALAMPPVPWDVALAKWFDVYFAPLEKHRSYARPSRRQASTPDIPRPSYAPLEIPTDSRTFGVVIDTSGSMEAKTIGKALGTIASYSVAHEVPFVRVVFCDAAAYDEGYISPEDIAGRVQVKGRGGTILQPGIDTLESAKDFPKDGPILIITDGATESHLDIRHEHAYLLPKGCMLPFRTESEKFYFEE